MTRLVLGVASDAFLSVTLSYAGEDSVPYWLGSQPTDSRCRKSGDVLGGLLKARDEPTLWASLPTVIGASAVAALGGLARLTFVSGAAHIPEIQPLVATYSDIDWIVWLHHDEHALVTDLVAAGAYCILLPWIPSGNAWRDRFLRQIRFRQVRESLNPVLSLLFGPVYIPHA